MLPDITPVILTFNEEDNIARTLDRLTWARDIVVVDSYSTDRTRDLVAAVPQTRFFQREFDTHERQWNFAIEDTAISTEWILALDADYLLSDAFIEEVAGLPVEPAVNGYSATVRYCIAGKPLRGSLYPPVTLLYRRGRARYRQDGHTQRIQVDGRVADLHAKILHDDRKPLFRWLQAQHRYMGIEAEHIGNAKWSELSAFDKLRRFPALAPGLAFAYCYFGKSLWLDGRAGLYYSLQRSIAEGILSLCLIERAFARD